MKRQRGIVRVLSVNEHEKGRQATRDSLAAGSPDINLLDERGDGKERKRLQRDECGRGQNRQGVRRRTAS